MYGGSDLYKRRNLPLRECGTLSTMLDGLQKGTLLLTNPDFFVCFVSALLLTFNERLIPFLDQGTSTPGPSRYTVTSSCPFLSYYVTGPNEPLESQLRCMLPQDMHWAGRGGFIEISTTGPAHETLTSSCSFLFRSFT